jgi:hypothetical protein
VILGAALAILAWLVASASGLPIDPFLPIVIALGLRREWPNWARVILAIALAPLAAAACGDVAAERAAVYAIAVMGCVNLSDWFDDSVVTRTGFAACALTAVLVVRETLHWAGSMPQGSDSLLSIVLSVTWVAVHATLCLAPSRGRS